MLMLALAAEQPRLALLALEASESDLIHLLLRGHASPDFWARTVLLQLRRLADEQERLDASGPSRPIYQEIQADLHFLLVAVRQILRVLERLEKVTHDQRLKNAAARFVETFPDAKNARDVLEHIDAYVTDEGKLSDQVRDPRMIVPTTAFDKRDDPSEELVFYVGDWKVPVRAAGREAVRIAALTEAVGRARLREIE